MAGIHKINEKTESNVCKQKKINSSHMNTVLDNLQKLRKDEVFCDIQLQTDDGTIISAHKIILASRCPYFFSMFILFNEKNKSIVNIKDLDSTILKLLLDFIYTGEVEISDQNVMDLLPAANIFQLDSVKALCCEFIQATLNPSNCISIKDFADLYENMELSKNCEEYIKKHFLEVIEQKEFSSLTTEAIINFISSDDIIVPFEEKVFECILKWVKHDLNCRYNSLPDIMEHVRLPLVPFEYLLKNVVKEPLLKHCYDFVTDAINYHKNKSKFDFINSHIRILPRNSYDLQKAILVLGYTRNRLPVLNWYYPAIDVWQMAPKIKKYHLPSALAVVRNQYIFVLNYFSRSVQILDINSKSPSWASTDMLVSRQRFGAGVLNDCLYVVGGFNPTGFLNSAEVYDITTKQWRMVSSMSALREGFGVGVLNNLLYAVGGFFAGSVLDTVECYNPSLDSWTQITRMSERRLGASVAVLNGLLYVIGGNNIENTLKSVETYDPNNGIWTSVANMHKRRAFAGVFTLDGLLYVLGGRNTYGVLQSIEIYSPETNAWSMKSLSKGGVLFCDGVVVNMAPNFRTNQWSDCYLL